MTKQHLVSIEDIAAEQRIPVGRALYLMGQSDAPRFAERTSRERLWNNAEVALYLRKGGVARC